MASRLTAPDGTIAALTELAEQLRGSFTTVEDMTTRFVRGAILTGAYRPGEHLAQGTIAEVLGVSRMPVRAALRELAAEGLVVFHPHRGAFVSTLSADDLAELFEIREALETIALRSVASRITPSDVARLRELASALDDVEAPPLEWRDRRTRFYEELYELAGKPRLLSLILKLRTEMGPYLMLQRVVEHDHDHGHQVLLDLLEQHDSSGARKWLRQHLRTVSTQLQQLVREQALDEEHGGG